MVQTVQYDSGVIDLEGVLLIMVLDYQSEVVHYIYEKSCFVFRVRKSWCLGNGVHVIMRVYYLYV